MRIAKPRLKPTGERLVGQQRVEMHGNLGHAHAMTPGRDRRVKIGQRLRVGEPRGLRDESLDKLKHAVGAVDKAIEELMGINAALAGSPLVEPAFGARRFFARRQPEEGQAIRALEMDSRFLELCPALSVDEVRDGVRKLALRITLCRNAACLDENRPAGPEPAQGVVEPRGGANELCRGCRIEIGSPEPGRALEAPILVEDHARCDERRPRQEIGKHSGFLAIFREVQHGILLHAKMRWITQVSAHDVDELRVAFCGPDRRHVPDRPEHKSGDPQAQSQADSSRERAVGDRNRAWRTAKQDRLRQSAMDRRFEPRDRIVRKDLAHQTSAPPPNEKNDRKNELAANAIERPNTIWTRRRKPPDVSPKASVSPVTMMMTTAMILATGPSIDCRICCNGCSQGMFEPAACAGAVIHARSATASIFAMRQSIRTSGLVMPSPLEAQNR